jgi:hypothetical protein
MQQERVGSLARRRRIACALGGRKGGDAHRGVTRCLE